jgi:hypothetical protein
LRARAQLGLRASADAWRMAMSHSRQSFCSPQLARLRNLGWYLPLSQAKGG